MSTRDDAYRTQVLPLVYKIMQRCREHDIYWFASFQADDVVTEDKAFQVLECQFGFGTDGPHGHRQYFSDQTSKPLKVTLQLPTRFQFSPQKDAAMKMERVFVPGPAEEKQLMNGSAALKLVLDEGVRVTRQEWVDESKAEGGALQWVGALRPSAFGIERSLSMTCSIGHAETSCLPALYNAWTHGEGAATRGSVSLGYKPALTDMLATDWFVLGHEETP